MRAGIKTHQPGRQMGNKFGYIGSQFMGTRMEDKRPVLSSIKAGASHKGISNESNTPSQHYEPMGLNNKPKLHRPMILEKAKRPGKKGKDHFE